MGNSFSESYRCYRTPKEHRYVRRLITELSDVVGPWKLSPDLRARGFAVQFAKTRHFRVKECRTHSNFDFKDITPPTSWANFWYCWTVRSVTNTLSCMRSLAASSCNSGTHESSTENENLLDSFGRVQKWFLAS